MKEFSFEALNSTEELNFLNYLPFIIWITDTNERLVFANEHFCNFFNLDPKNIDKSNEFVKTIKIDSEIENEMEIKSIEIQVEDKNKQKHWLEIHLGSIINTDKNILGKIFIAHTITTKKENEIQQKRIQNQLIALIRILTNPTENFQNETFISTSIQTIFDFFNNFRISYLTFNENGYVDVKYSVEPNNFNAIPKQEVYVEDLESYLSYLQTQGFLCYDDISKIDGDTVKPIFTNYQVSSILDVPIRFEHTVIAILRIDSEFPYNWHRDEILSFSEIGKRLSTILQRSYYQQKLIEYENELEKNYRKLEDSLLEINELKELHQKRSEDLFINKELLEEQAFSINLLNQQLLDKEEKILETNKQLESALNQRDKFFSIIAHDLRGPLSSFKDMTKMISEQSEQFTKDELIEISHLIHNNAETLYSLIENLLNWSRLQRNIIVAEPQLINVKIVVDATLNIYKESITIKRIEVIDKVKSNHFIYCDLNMFESVLRNIISNAVKFTPRGGKIFIVSYEHNKNYIAVSITDTGIGMSKELIDNLFKIDEKTSRLGTEGEPSTGLGLVLCKELVERNEGSLNVISAEGVGSKFEIILPKKTILDDLID